MRKRSDAIRERNATRSSAEERTVDLPKAPPGAMVSCEACGETARAEDCSTRGDGLAECPSCGAPARLDASAKPAEEKKIAVGATGPVYCAKCGSEWPIVKGSAFPNCGHAGEWVADPREAEKINPPAGLATRSTKEAERRNAADAPSGRPDGSPRLGATKIDLTGNRLTVAWGKSTFQIAPYASFTVGDFYWSTELAPGDDAVAVGRAMIAELRAIANEAFAAQEAWYREKFEKLAK